MKILSKEEFENLMNRGAVEITSKYGKEFGDYAKEYRSIINDESEVWQVFLWKKDENGKIKLDLSEENIKKCQQIYDKNPNDIYNLLRLLMLKIFTDQDYNNLASQFVIFWKKKEVNVNFYFTVLWELEEVVKPYFLKLRNFLTLLIQVSPVKFKEDIDESVEEAFLIHNKVVGISELSKIITDTRKLLLEDFDFDWDSSYIKYYVLAKFYHSKKRWFDAFCLFTKLFIYNQICKVTNEELLELSKCNREYSEDILLNPPTIEEVDNNADDCFARINLSDKREGDKLTSLIANLYVKVWKSQNNIQNLEQELNSYLNIYTLFANIFTELSKGEYERAFNRWVGWDKGNVKMIGIDIGETTQYLKRLKDGIGNENENIASLFSKNYFVQYFGYISNIEIKLREFVVESLKIYYDDETEAWFKGVPSRIRIECKTRTKK